MSIILLILFCDYCLQTFLSTSTVSFAPLLLNIASISSCPYLRDNVWIKSSRLYFVFCIFLYFIFCKLKCSCAWLPVWGVSHSCSPAHWSGKISQKLVPCDQSCLFQKLLARMRICLHRNALARLSMNILASYFPPHIVHHKQHQILHQQHNGSNISSRKTKR